VSCHIGVEPSQLFGKWIPTQDGHFAWQDGAVTDIVRNGGTLLINEVSFMPERVSTVLFSLLDDRREIQLMDKNGEVIKAHPDLLVVADYNPNYRGSRELNQAFNDRFGIQLDFPYDPTIEAKLIKNKAILEMAKQLRSNFDLEQIRTPISTRTLQTFVRNSDTLGLEFAIYSYVNTFPQNEQAPVRLVIDTHRANIEREMGIAPAVVETAPEVLLTPALNADGTVTFTKAGI
jgi:MoxR-like ATPase